MLLPRYHYQDVEVRPEAIQLFLEAFSIFPSIGQKYLVKHGILPPAPKTLPPGRYIPLTAWLDAFREIMNEVGPGALFRVGQHIIRNPHLPPNVHELEPLLRHIDIGFHLSHFKQGKPMFDVATKQFVEGIGHFMVERRRGDKAVIVRCDTPYPCPLEHGIVSGVTAKVEPRASIVHHEPRVCRMNGAERCSYLVRW